MIEINYKLYLYLKVIRKYLVYWVKLIDLNNKRGGILNWWIVYWKIIDMK